MITVIVSVCQRNAPDYTGTCHIPSDGKCNCCWLQGAAQKNRNRSSGDLKFCWWWLKVLLVTKSAADDKKVLLVTNSSAGDKKCCWWQKSAAGDKKVLLVTKKCCWWLKVLLVTKNAADDLASVKSKWRGSVSRAFWSPSWQSSRLGLLITDESFAWWWLLMLEYIKN